MPACARNAAAARGCELQLFLPIDGREFIEYSVITLGSGGVYVAFWLIKVMLYSVFTATFSVFRAILVTMRVLPPNGRSSPTNRKVVPDEITPAKCEKVDDALPVKVVIEGPIGSMGIWGRDVSALADHGHRHPHHDHHDLRWSPKWSRSGKRPQKTHEERTCCG